MRERISLMHGSIDFNSQPGKGTKIKIRISIKLSIQMAKIKVILLMIMPLSGMGLKHLIRCDEIEVINEAYSAEDFLDILKSQQPDIAILISAS